MSEKWKRGLIIVLVAVMTFLQSSPLVSEAKEPQIIEFQCDDINAECGQTITIPIKIHSSDSDIELGGLQFSLTYGNNLTYVEGSDNTITSSMKGAYVYNRTKNQKITLVWTGDSAVKLSNDVICFKPSFKVKDSAVSSTLTLTIDEAYTYTGDKGTDFEDLTVDKKTVSIELIVGNTSAIKNTETLINNIGTVTYTTESLNKIMAAASAYSVLTESQKKQVSNYEVLSAAMLEYERLRIEAEGSATGAEISAYMEKHKNALNLTTETVEIKDEEAVLKALEDFGKLSANAQSEIYSYKRTLNNVLKKIETLKLEEEARKKAEEREKKERKEAQEYAEAFKEEYKYFLELKAENLVKDHYTGLDAAVSKLNMLSGLNPYVDEYLKAEKIIIKGLYEKVQELMKQGDSGTGDNATNAKMSADSFRTNFSYVLSLTEDTVTVDDLLELRVAEAVYYELDAEVQNLLSEEFNHISALLSVAEELSGDLPDSESNGKFDVTMVQSGGFFDSLTMRFSGRQMGAIVWILLLLLILSMIIFATLQVVYHVYKKGGANYADFKKEAD